MKHISIFLLTFFFTLSSCDKIHSLVSCNQNELVINSFNSSIIDTFYASSESVFNIKVEINYKISDSVYIELNEGYVKWKRRVPNSQSILDTDSVETGLYPINLVLDPQDSVYVFDGDWYGQLCFVKISTKNKVTGNLHIKANF